MLDEGAAKALLLTWSITDQIASSVVTLGAPDLRVLIFMPIGFLWTGSTLAAKIFTILLTAYTARLLFSWIQERINSESALLSTGLFLISPLTLTSIDTLSPAVFILLGFIVGALLDREYRIAPRPFGGWYFGQLLAAIFCVSLHPIGLAYPIALAWSWIQNPLDKNQKKYFLLGLIIVVSLTLVVRGGWNDLLWLQNPLDSLASITLGVTLDGDMSAGRWVAATLTATALLGIIISQFRTLLSDLTGRILFIALALGIFVGDSNWGLIALCTILYFGIPALTTASVTSAGFMRQRGLTLFTLVVLSILFTFTNKANYLAMEQSLLPSQDLLIRSLSDDVASARKAAEESDQNTSPRFRVASQWPSRTMIACKCDTLPLPPAAKDPESQLVMLRSITHILFNPVQPSNLLLSRNLASLGGARIETVDLQSDGVLLRLRETSTNNAGAK